ncbi:MAG: dTMP kinase, partial [Nanoarchaeota archaeon]|nr:dTMP kinase [Nanoarchaeota archaeon]
GTSTQVQRLAEHIENLNKYQAVLKTHEPWENEEIKRKLREDKDAYSDGLEMGNLYIGDRAIHTHVLIRPNLKAGTTVITDRYKMSTCDYQWAQGVPLEELIEMHKNRGILTPDHTFLIDTPQKVAAQRLMARGDPREKFDKDPEFVQKLVDAYRSLYHMSNVDPSFFGNVTLIDGSQSRKKITEDVTKVFDPLYRSWQKGEYIPQISREKS